MLRRVSFDESQRNQDVDMGSVTPSNISPRSAAKRQKEADQHEQNPGSRKTQYDAAQFNSMLSYEQIYRAAMQQKSARLYQETILNLEAAISEMNVVKARYINHRFESNPFTYENSCPEAEKRIAQCRLHIADCWYWHGDYEAAYNAYARLDSNVNPAIRSKKLNQCIQKLQNRADAIIRSVAQRQTNGNAQNIFLAKEQLEYANKLLKSVGVYSYDDLEQQKTRIYWDEHRERINESGWSLLTAPHSFQNYWQIVQQMNSVLQDYDKAMQFLNEDESFCRQELRQRLAVFEQRLAVQLDQERRERERQANLNAQQDINVEIKRLILDILEAKLPQAFSRLERIIDMTDQMSANAQVDIEQAGLNYTPQNIFLGYQRILSPETAIYNLDKYSQRTGVVKQILSCAEEKLKARYDNYMLSNNDIGCLNVLISEQLDANWHKFYKVGVPHLLIEKVADIISSNAETLGIIGMAKKWLTWSYNDLCFNNQEEVFSKIEVAFIAQKLPLRNEPIVQLPIFEGMPAIELALLVPEEENNNDSLDDMLEFDAPAAVKVEVLCTPMTF